MGASLSCGDPPASHVLGSSGLIMYSPDIKSTKHPPIISAQKFGEHYCFKRGYGLPSFTGGFTERTEILQENRFRVSRKYEPPEAQNHKPAAEPVVQGERWQLSALS